MISPLDKDCEQHFAYQIDGTVEALDDAAKYTIRVLALNDKRLCRAREAALWESGVFTDSVEKKQEMLAKFENPEIKKQMPYWDAIRYFLREEDKICEI